MVYYVEQGFIFGDVCHRSAVVGVTDTATRVNDAHERHAPKFEEADFLTILDRDAMLGVGQADERDFFLFPILLEGGFGVRAEGENLRAALLEFFVFIADARQRRAAIGSHEAAQEVQHNGLAAKIREAHEVAVQVVEFEFGGEFAGGEEFHLRSAFVFVQIPSNISTVNFPVDVFCWLG